VERRCSVGEYAYIIERLVGVVVGVLLGCWITTWHYSHRITLMSRRYMELRKRHLVVCPKEELKDEQ